MRNFLIAFITVSLISCHSNSEHNNTDKSFEPPSWTIEGFQKMDEHNPILIPDATSTFECPVSKKVVQWEGRNVLNPTAIVIDEVIHLIYRAQDDSMTSRLGHATSTDGIHFTKDPKPVFYPDNDEMNLFEWPGGVEDPRIVGSEDGRYFMTYTSYDGKTARLCLASSPDLINWTKHGLVLSEEKYQDTWSKAGAIVSKMQNSQPLASKIDGKYWMYYGDTDLFLMYSEDLIHWDALVDEYGERLSVLHPRPGYFDSRLVEPGPFAMQVKDGISMIYNASNAKLNNDPNLPIYTYAPGQVLFDESQPYKMLKRTPTYFLKPDKEYERVGEVNEVCFVEGLVPYNGNWYLYYGTADSKIGVAKAKMD